MKTYYIMHVLNLTQNLFSPNMHGVLQQLVVHRRKILLHYFLVFRDRNEPMVHFLRLTALPKYQPKYIQQTLLHFNSVLFKFYDSIIKIFNS